MSNKTIDDIMGGAAALAQASLETRPGSVFHAMAALAVAQELLKRAAMKAGVSAADIDRCTKDAAVQLAAEHLTRSGQVQIRVLAMQKGGDA